MANDMRLWTEGDDTHMPRSKRAVPQLEPLQYGTSVLGAPLHAYLPYEWSAKRTLVMAGIHGENQEPATTAILSAAFRSIKPETLCCAVILCANPDGIAHGTRTNANNVDLNRNFPTGNWEKRITTSKWEEWLVSDVEHSSGESPASEPETQTLIRFIEEHKIE